MSSAKNAIEYYDAHLSQPLEGYYLSEQDQIERNGKWFGKTAQLFGLEGKDVTREEFAQLADHVNPLTGEQLTVRRNSNRRVGYDFSFALPKTASIAAIDDERINEALLRVSREVMGEIEKDIQVRVRVDGQDTDRTSGNLIASEHIHTVTRPLKSTGLPQPHSHVHFLVFNVSHDDSEKKFKAIQLGNVQPDRPYYQAMFHSRMAQELRTLGYKTRRTDKAYEIAGIPESAKTKFSKRSEEIAKLVEKLGLTNEKAKANAGAWSREKKSKTFTLSALREIWNAMLTKEEHVAIERARTGDDSGSWAASAPVTPEQAVDWAMRHGHETQSTMNLRRVMADALHHGVGHVSPERVLEEAHRDDIVHVTLAGEQRVGSRDILKQEQDFIEQAKAGRGSRRRLIMDPLEFEPIEENGHVFELNDDQKEAIEQIAASRDKYLLVEGKAGTGKTSMMKTAVEKLVAQTGKHVTTIAPTAQASRSVLRKEGFADADTLQRFLRSEEQLKAARGNIVWLDESAIASAQDLAALFEAADRYEFDRVFLQGDPSQHQSAQRSGGLFSLLKTHAGLKPAVLDTVMRQKGDYAKAERLIGAGKLEAGFNLLDKLGMIVEVPSGELYEKAAEAVSTSMQRGVETGLASPTRAAGAQATNALRNSLREQGRLGTSEKRFRRLESRHLSVAQREVATNYREQKDIVQFMMKVRGFKVGERVRVQQQLSDQVIVQHQDGRVAELPLDAADRFDVFSEKSIVFSEADTRRTFTEGDRVTIRRNGKSQEGSVLNKGDEFLIASVNKTELELVGGEVIPKTLARKIRVEGDRIRITANGKTKDGKKIDNGTIVEVKRFTKTGDIELTNGRVLDKDFASFELGWAMTSHASQGAGFRKHVVVQPSDSFGPASNVRQFYVDSSRGKGARGLLVFTDDKVGLKRAVSRVGGDMSMTEAMEQNEEKQHSFEQPRARYGWMQSAAAWATEWMKEKWMQLSQSRDNALASHRRSPQMGS